MPGEALISVEHLSRNYGAVRAVEDVNFELRRGEVLGFLGPNGAGKTTTMQIVCGALAPDAGRVRVDGIDLLDRPRAAKARLGYLPEQPPLYRDLTVDEYLRYCARLRGVARRGAGAALARAKERCGLSGEGPRLIGNLSKGFQQRVGIAQAIVHTPAVVVLDEPTVGLDPNQIREIRALIRELGADHGVILSTHILPEVQSTCDRVQIIHRGRLVLSETLADLSGPGEAGPLRAGLRRPPSMDALSSIPGVERAEPLGDGRIRLYPRADAPQAAALPEAVAEAAVAQGWGLFELVRETRSLEEIFIELTAGDTAGAGTGAQAAGPEAAP